jgi:hypothetical protein
VRLVLLGVLLAAFCNAFAGEIENKDFEILFSK